MASEKGRVNELAEACITIQLVRGQSIECVIDTGFSGGLMLPRSFVEQIPHTEIGKESYVLAGGGELKAEIVGVEIHWLNTVKALAVVVSEASDSLIGTGLLEKAILVIDYLTAQVEIKDDQEN